MIIDILLVIFIIADVVGCYIIWNLNRKLEHLESWVEGFVVRVGKTYNDLMEVDSTGHFEADDEVGSIFEGIKSIITELNDSMEEEV